MLYVAGLALVVGAVIGLAVGGRPRYFGRHRVRAWWLVIIGFGLQVAADRLAVGSFGTFLVLVGAAALLAFATLNPTLAGIGVVAVGVALNALIIGINDGMPVRPSSVVAAGIATKLEEPTLGYGGRHHRQRAGDHFVLLGDIIPIPALHEVVSFADLIVAVGVATTVAHLLKPISRHGARETSGSQERRPGWAASTGVREASQVPADVAASEQPAGAQRPAASEHSTAPEPKAQPATAQPPTLPGPAQPATAQPATAQRPAPPGPAQPATAQPATAQPATAQPATAQPPGGTGTGGAMTQPATAQPATAQPPGATGTGGAMTPRRQARRFRR